MLRLFGPDQTNQPADPGSLKKIPRSVSWVDLVDPTRAEEKLVEAALGRNIPSREEMAEIELSSRLYKRNQTLFMTISMLHGMDKGQPGTDPVSFILTDKLLVTVRYIEPEPFSEAIELAESEPPPDAQSALLLLLDTLVDRLADEMEETGHEIDSVSGRVFSRGTLSGRRERRSELKLEALLLRIGGVQRALAEIRDSAVSTGRMLSFLAAELGPIDSDPGRGLETLQEDIRALLDHSSSLNDNLSFLLNAAMGMITLEQNFVMKIFSVVAVVLMPPTLIAGIYGMNFRHMPELEWMFGYPMALGLIALSAVLPYWLARRSGWL